MKPELVKIVEDKTSQIHAFIFAIPDYFDSTGKTIIIKSAARKSDTPFKGIISHLSAVISQTAKLMGYEKAIHAMMFEDNLSVNISERYAGKPFKRYVLYKAELA